LLTDRDEISNLYREPSIGTSYQVSLQLAKQGRRFLEIDQSETRIACSSQIWWEAPMEGSVLSFFKAE
jgi:hypothetical protein